MKPQFGYYKRKRVAREELPQTTADFEEAFTNSIEESRPENVREPTEKERTILSDAHELVRGFLAEKYGQIDFQQILPEKVWVSEGLSKKPHMREGGRLVMHRKEHGDYGDAELFRSTIHELFHHVSTNKRIISSHARQIHSGFRRGINRFDPTTGARPEAEDLFIAFDEAMTELLARDAIQTGRQHGNTYIAEMDQTHQAHIDEIRTFIPENLDLADVDRIVIKDEKVERVLSAYQFEVEMLRSIFDQIAQSQGLSSSEIQSIFQQGFFHADLSNTKKVLQKTFGKFTLRMLAHWRPNDFDNERGQLLKTFFSNASESDREKAAKVFLEDPEKQMDKSRIRRKKTIDSSGPRCQICDSSNAEGTTSCTFCGSPL